MDHVEYEGLKIPVNDFKRKAIRIAKQENISMTIIREDLVEFIEPNREKAANFVREIKSFSPGTRMVELISCGQDTDVRGNRIYPGRSLYLIDDDYYKALMGEGAEEKIEQITMF